ncbi:hypothetical protein QJS04_geneDACA015731 [Acorus gramineus]|uniref:Uncharacterized protein n=1 Tax=Acorus gramineus TaxID=55184 RepID=A0AAV9BT83_ACOGR|nr:hypothetical protein QJS04_geneDACA015731 [Acorus gramineus]
MTSLSIKLKKKKKKNRTLEVSSFLSNSLPPTLPSEKLGFFDACDADLEYNRLGEVARAQHPQLLHSSSSSPEPQKDKYDGNHNTENGSSAVPVKRPSRRIFISPALYATPKPTPIPGSPTCVSPSPYVVNHKHRRPPTDEAASRHNGFQVPPSQNPHFNAEDPANSKHGFSTDNPSIELKKNKKKKQGEEEGEEEVEGEMMEGISCEHVEGLGAERDEDVESVDTTCSSDMEDGGNLGRGGSFGRQTLFSSLTEFYDAAEELLVWDYQTSNSSGGIFSRDFFG